MTTGEWVDEDPVLYFLLGRRSSHLIVHAALCLAFALCLGVAALRAAGFLGVIGGIVAMAAVVVCVSWWVVPQVSLLVAALAFLFINGFVVDLQGTLSWHGASDAWILVALAAGAWAASIAGRWHAERLTTSARARETSRPLGSRMFWKGAGT